MNDAEMENEEKYRRELTKRKSERISYLGIISLSSLVHRTVCRPDRTYGDTSFHSYTHICLLSSNSFVFQMLTWTCKLTPKGKLSREIIGKRLLSGG